MDRRDFLKKCGLFALGTLGSACLYGLSPLTGVRRLKAAEKDFIRNKKWGMVIDCNKCRSDCNRCMDACRKENNVAFFGNKNWDIHWIKKANVKRTFPVSSNEISVPLLCNHCDNPPCVPVCPVKASYKRPDGIVVVDYHRCIGCRYCVIACPYNARQFNFKTNPEWPNKEHPIRAHGVAESCTFCASRVEKGKKPACVEACKKAGYKAMTFGNLEDPKSKVSKMISTNRVKGIREDLGTKPKVFYLGL